MAATTPRPPDTLRWSVVQTVIRNLPAYATDAWFSNEVCQGRLNIGYNSAPDLCHWLLWKLGCRTGNLLCRDVPENKIVWSPDGMARLLWGAQCIAAWHPFLLEQRPEPGDILFLGNRKAGEPEHICIFLRRDGDMWVTADAGQNVDGVQCARIMCRKFYGYHLFTTQERKQINGWVDITQIPREVKGLSIPPSEGSGGEPPT